jgi:ELWxxDGT repeat protein
MKKLFLGLLVSVTAAAAGAQTPYLVKDINTTTSRYPSSSSPYGFIQYSSRVFFAASNPSYDGVQLWSTDGTASGTKQIAVFDTGRDGDVLSRFMVVNGTLVFNANDGVHGEELWTTDGTAAGTRILADINSGPNSSSPGDRIVYHGRMYFAAGEPVYGNELWVTDGTPAGTHFLKDLAPGPNSSNPSSFVIFNDTLYFSAAGALWKSDGTDAGTVQVKSGVGVFNLTVAGSHLFFAGLTPDSGNEPWVSDGTEGGTHMIADLWPGGITGSPKGSYPSGLTAFGDRILFFASDPQHGYEPWISDGTAAGTHIVRDIAPVMGEGSTSQYAFAVAGATAYFAATAKPGTPYQLWRTDGTEGGTQLVRDGGAGGDGVFGITAAGDKVYFGARSTDGNTQTLWVTDGTSAGTRQVMSQNPVEVSFPLTNIGSTLYFDGANSLNGFEPWKSDGTEGGTAMIMNLADDLAPSSEPSNFTTAADLLYFEAWDGLTPAGYNAALPTSLWRSDGTSAGTVKLADAPHPPYIASGRTLFFTKEGALWITDGTPEGTKPAAAFAARFPSPPTVQYALGDKIFATADTTLYVTALSSSAPAVPLGVRSGSAFTALAGRVYFLSGSSIWTSDGTPEGTYLVASLGDVNVYATTMVTAAGFLWVNGTKLWKSDGTPDGTAAVSAVTGGASNLTPAGRNLFFTSGGQLWVSDGTDAGTRALGAISLYGTMAAIGDGVVFGASDSSNGTELWGSDGTPAGTHILRDIQPGTKSSYPSFLTSAAGVVYFSASDFQSGSQLWVTDGTADGTKVVSSVHPASPGYQATNFAVAGDRLFFPASTDATGIELWALPLPPRMGISDARVVEGDSGTVTARFTVTLSSPATQSVSVDYATANGTATAGSDYDAVSGTLTFAPGETAKNVDVPVHGDTTSEGNETFSVTLRNAAGASIEKRTGFGVIEDDDATADVALSLDFSQMSLDDVRVVATNNGPRTATNIKVTSTVTPTDLVSVTTQTCYAGLPAQLASGASTCAFDYRDIAFQQYHTAAVTAHQRDPQPSNNVVAWTNNQAMAMDALSIAPGGQANVWIWTNTSSPSASVESSDPSIVSVPASVTVPSGNQVGTFVARGVSAGTATIRVFSGTSTYGTLAVTVAAPGTSVRWPGAVIFGWSTASIPFDQPAVATVANGPTAPYSGAIAGGVVTLTLANGQTIGSTTLPSPAGRRSLFAYLPDLGTYTLNLNYAGDANFLPMTAHTNVTVVRGNATILAFPERTATTATLHVRLSGSPAAAPSGTITITENPALQPVQATLDAGAADVTLTNVSAGVHTYRITYSGDTHYQPSTQTVRMGVERRRAARP